MLWQGQDEDEDERPSQCQRQNSVAGDEDRQVGTGALPLSLQAAKRML